MRLAPVRKTDYTRRCMHAAPAAQPAVRSRPRSCRDPAVDLPGRKDYLANVIKRAGSSECHARHWILAKIPVVPIARRLGSVRRSRWRPPHSAPRNRPCGLYKWTDANGRVVYSDQPPPPNVKSETLAAPPPGNPNALKELLQKMRVAAAAGPARRSREEGGAGGADAQTRRAQCTQVQGQIGQLSASQELVYRYNEKGERVVLDDAARRAEREKLEAWVRDNCRARSTSSRDWPGSPERWPSP